jgi:Fe-S cluster assembly protein SufD
MLEVLEEKNSYLSSFAQFEKGQGAKAPVWLRQLRNAAIDRFAELGFPTVRDEEWRFTNVAPLVRIPFKPAVQFDLTGPALENLERSFFDTDACIRLAFVNGRFSPRLSRLKMLPEGVIVASLASILDAHPEWVEPHLARHAEYEEQAFTALNTAFIQDGAFVSIPKGVVLKQPLHLAFLASTGSKTSVAYPRNLILAGVNSQATIVESYIGSKGDVYFTNAVTELITDENAVIDHYKLQRESTEAFHVATMQVRLGRSSNVASHSIALGGALVRNDVNAFLAGEGGECTLNGLYLAAGRQTIDNHTRIDHAMPHCASHELYKGILDGQAHGVFNGKIYVHPDAQKTDAKQTNKTLLLSPDAVINTKPQLEIYADDVKCTHGATIGQLADEALFYLRSRGIGRDDARNLLTFAFANDIISRIKIEPIRAQLEGVLLANRPTAATLSAKEVL